MGASAPDFNEYILAAVDRLASTRAGLGYASASYTQDLRFGDVGTLKASRPPYTMCVAAQVEVISTAFEIYAAKTGDRSVYKYLPLSEWTRLRPGTLRGKIWIVDDSGSWGTANALQTFGMGVELPFTALKAGSFINLNRDRTGHAVVFLAYIDRNGDDLPSYNDAVAGFRYFSSQGSATNGGFGYRHAFFQDAGCPTLSKERKRDCGVIRTQNQRLLNTGIMLHPSSWDRGRRDKALAFSNAVQKGPELAFDEKYFNGRTTDDD